MTKTATMMSTDYNAIADSIFQAVKAYCAAEVSRRTKLLETMTSSLLQRVDQLAADNAALRERVAVLDTQQVQPTLRSVR
jgi:hypothetical protein